MRRLVCTFVGRILQKLVFSWRGSIMTFWTSIVRVGYMYHGSVANERNLEVYKDIWKRSLSISFAVYIRHWGFKQICPWPGHLGMGRFVTAVANRYSGVEEVRIDYNRVILSAILSGSPEKLNFSFIQNNYWNVKITDTLILYATFTLTHLINFMKMIISQIVSWTKYEPPRDKTNKVSVRWAKTRISLGIRPVWSESSLSAWRKLGP